MAENKYLDKFRQSGVEAVESYKDMYAFALNDYEDRAENNEKFRVAERQQEINDRNENKQRKELEDTGKINEYWNNVTDFFGLDSMRTTEVKDGRIYDSRNKDSGLYDGMSKEQLVDIIKESQEDETAEYILYQKKIPVGINDDGSIRYGYKNGIAKNSMWEREQQSGIENGEEIMWAKRIAGAEDIESRINQIAFEEKKNIFEIGESAGTLSNLGSGYTEIQNEAFIDYEQFNDKADRKSFLRKDLFEQADKTKYRKEHGDTGLLNYVAAVGSGAISLTGDLIDLGATAIGFVGNELGLKNDLANNNWGDQLSASADDIANYNRTASQTAMTESANRWKNGDYVGAIFNGGSLDMAESAFESLPEMALMAMSFGSGAVAKGASLASKISKSKSAALVAGDAVKFAQLAKKENMMFQALKSPTLKEAVLANKYINASSVFLKANAGLELAIAKNTNNVIEDRIANGDEDVTIAEASAILFSQVISTSLDKMAFMSTVKSNPAIKESVTNLMSTLSDTAKKSLMAKVTIATAGIAKAMGTEAAQEHLQTWTEIFGKDLGVKGKTASEVWNDEENQDEALKATLAGAVSGGVMHAIPDALRGTKSLLKSETTSSRLKRVSNTFRQKLNPNADDVTISEMMDISDLDKQEYSTGAKFHFVNTKMLEGVKAGKVTMDEYVTAYDKIVKEAGIKSDNTSQEFADRKFARIVVASFGDSLKDDQLKKLKDVTDPKTFSYVISAMEQKSRDKVSASVEDIMAEHIVLGSDKSNDNNIDGFDAEFYAEYDENGNPIERDEINPLYGVFNDEINVLEEDIQNITNVGGDASGLIKMHAKLREINDSTKPPKDMNMVANEVAVSGLTIDGVQIDDYGSIAKHTDDIADVVTAVSDDMADTAPLKHYLRFVTSRSNLLLRNKNRNFSLKLINKVTSENKSLFGILKNARIAVVANNAISEDKKTEMLKILDKSEVEAKNVSRKYAEVLFNNSNFKLASEHSQAKKLVESDIDQIYALASQATTVEELDNVTRIMKDNFYYPPEDMDMTDLVDYISSKKYFLISGKGGKEVQNMEFEALVQRSYNSQDNNLAPIDDELFDDLTKHIKTPEDQERILGLLANRRLSKDQTRRMIKIISGVKPEEKNIDDEPSIATAEAISQLKILATRINALKRKGNKNLEEEISHIEIIAMDLNLSTDIMMKYFYSNIDDDIKPVNRDDLIGSVQGLIDSLKYDDDLKAEDVRAYRDQIIKEATDTINNINKTHIWIMSLTADRLMAGLVEIIDIIWKRLTGLQNKSKSQIKLIEKLGEYAAKIDKGEKLHRMSIESLRSRLGVEKKGKKVSLYTKKEIVDANIETLDTEVVEDEEQKKIGNKDRKLLTYNAIDESILKLKGQKRIAYKKKLNKINKITNDFEFFKQMKALASLVKKEIKLLDTEVVEDEGKKQIANNDKKKLLTYNTIDSAVSKLDDKKRIAYKKKIDKINTVDDDVTFFEQMKIVADLVKKETVKLIENKKSDPATGSNETLLLGYKGSIDTLNKLDFTGGKPHVNQTSTQRLLPPPLKNQSGTTKQIVNDIVANEEKNVDGTVKTKEQLYKEYIEHFYNLEELEAKYLKWLDDKDNNEEPTPEEKKDAIDHIESKSDFILIESGDQEENKKLKLETFTPLSSTLIDLGKAWGMSKEQSYKDKIDKIVDSYNLDEATRKMYYESWKEVEKKEFSEDEILAAVERLKKDLENDNVLSKDDLEKFRAQLYREVVNDVGEIRRLKRTLNKGKRLSKIREIYEQIRGKLYDLKLKIISHFKNRKEVYLVSIHVSSYIKRLENPDVDNESSLSKYEKSCFASYLGVSVFPEGQRNKGNSIVAVDGDTTTNNDDTDPYDDTDPDDDTNNDDNASPDDKPATKKRLDRRAEETLLEIQRIDAKYGKEDGVPQMMRTVMNRLKVPVKAIIRTLRLGSIDEKNRSITSMLNILEKRYKFEISTAFDSLDDTIEYANELNKKLYGMSNAEKKLALELERKDLVFAKSKRLKRRHKEILARITKLYGQLQNTPDPESRLGEMNEIVSLVTEAIRINPSDTAFAVAFIDKYKSQMEELAYEYNDAEYHMNIKKFNKALRYSSYGLLSLSEKIEATREKLNSITDKYLEKRATTIRNIEAKNKQLALIADIRKSITETTSPSLEEVMDLISKLENKYIANEQDSPLEPSSTTSMFIGHGNTSAVLEQKPTLLSYIGDAVALLRKGKPFKPAIDTIEEHSNSIANSEDGLEKVIHAVNLLASFDAEAILKKYINLNFKDGVITPMGEFFNISGLLVDEDGNMSKVLADAIKQAAILLSPAIEDTRISLLRYDADEYGKYFGIKTDEEIAIFKSAALDGYVPMSFIKKEARRILIEILGIVPNAELDMKSKELVESGLTAMVIAGMKAMSNGENPPFHFTTIDTSDTKSNLNFIKVNLTKEDVSSLSAVLHLTGSNRKSKPSLRPFKVRETVKNGTAELTEYDIKQLEQRNNTKNYFTSEAKEAHNIWMTNPQELYEILGFMTEPELELLNPKDRKVAEITNQSIIRFTDDMFSNYAAIQDKPFYLDNYVMRSGRTSSSGEITPFESKLQRLFLTKDSFRKTVMTPTKSDKREPVEMIKDGMDDFNEIEQFEIALAGHLGIKTDARSKFHVFGELRKIIDIYADEDNMLVDKSGKYDYIKDIIDNRMENHFDSKSVLSLFKNPKYKLDNKSNNSDTSYQTMKAAMAIQNIVTAKTVGEDNFSTNLSFFADAISSGPANITMQSGESGSNYQSMLEKAGILTDDQLERRTKYTKYLLSKKYNIDEDLITFNMASLIEAGKYHSDEATPSDIKDGAYQIDDVFYDIYETVGVALFTSLHQDNVDTSSETLKEKKFHSGNALKLFAKRLLGGKSQIDMKTVRKIAKPAVMVKWYGAQESSIKRNYINEHAFDEFYKSANSDDKAFFEEIVLSITSNEEITDINKRNNIIINFLADKRNFDRDMPEDLLGGDRLPYLVINRKVFDALNDATGPIFGDVIAAKITKATPLQAHLTDAIKSTEPIVFAMSKVILDAEIAKVRKETGKVTRKQYIDIMNRLAKEGNAHAIYGLNRIHSFYKEDKTGKSDSINSIEEFGIKVNGNEEYTTATGSEEIFGKEPTSAFGGFATLYIHSKDGEGMEAGLDGTDYTSVYDEIEFPASLEEMNLSADRYQDSIYKTGKEDFTFGRIAKHIIRMRKYINDNNLNDELAKEFNLAEINDKGKVKIVGEDMSNPAIKLDIPEPHIAIIGGKVAYQKKRNGKKITETKYTSRTLSNGTVEHSQRFYSNTGANGELQEVMRIVTVRDISGSVIENFAFLSDFSLKNENILNGSTKVIRVDLNPSLDVQQSLNELKSNPDLRQTTLYLQDKEKGFAAFENYNLTDKATHIATVHELKSDYLVRSGFSTGFENTITTLLSVSKNREDLYSQTMNIAQLNTLGVNFKKIEPDENIDIDNITTEEIFAFAEIYSELQSEYQDSTSELASIINENSESKIKNIEKIKPKSFDKEILTIDGQTLDIIKEYLTDTEKGC